MNFIWSGIILFAIRENKMISLILNFLGELRRYLAILAPRLVSSEIHCVLRSGREITVL